MTGQTLIVQSRADPCVPLDAQGIAVLFKRAMDRSDVVAQGLDALEVYRKPHEIETLRKIVGIYELPSERERLLALRNLIKDRNALYQENFLADVHDMRERDSFPILLGSLPMLDERGQLRLVETIAEIGDLRGVPLLIQIMQTPASTPAQRTLAQQAAAQLTRFFPGAPGVTEACQRVLAAEHLGQIVARYAMKHDPTIKLPAPPQKPPFRLATELEEAGDQNRARAMWLRIAEDPLEEDWARLWAAEHLSRSRVETERERIRRALLPLVERIARSGDYLQCRSAVQTLRALKHPDTLQSLLCVLDKQSWLFEKATKPAVMALRELGQTAQQRAAVLLTEKTGALIGAGQAGHLSNLDLLLVPLMWLGDEKTFAEVERLLDGAFRQHWARYVPLRAAIRSGDETAALIGLLTEPNALPEEAMLWIIFRLGDLKDKRAMGPLVRHLDRRTLARPDLIIEALTQFEGADLQQEIERQLARSDRNGSRRNLTDLLFSLPGDGALPLARSLITGSDNDVKASALNYIGRVGTPEDLGLLVPLSDFWTAERTLHYWMISAIADLRDRHNFDINGPVKRR